MEELDAHAFFRSVVAQDGAAMERFLATDARVDWPCTNERFTAAEYVRVNCAYPGKWDGAVERVERPDGLIVLAGRIWEKEGSRSLHVVSFIRTENGRITEMTEYFADDGETPAWRKELGTGRPLK